MSLPDLSIVGERCVEEKRSALRVNKSSLVKKGEAWGI